MDIAFIGLGLMGQAMARRLILSGHTLTVYNRTREKAAPLEKLGAKVGESAAAAVAAAPVTVLMAANAEAIEAILFPPTGPRPDFAGRTVIQMGTIAPEQSLDFKKRVEASGGAYAEAPVLGGPPEAESGQLHVLVGATPGQYEEWRPLLQALSPAPQYIGPVGKAAAFKLALNQILAAEAAAFAYSLAIVSRNGIEVERFMGVLRASSLYAPQFEKKLSRMLNRDFVPASFAVKNIEKDVKLAVAEGRRLGLDTSAVEGIGQVVHRAAGAGLSGADYSAIYAVINPEKA